MKTVRLTSGLGFYGDNWSPVLAAIERGNVQYVCSDHLAELTLAILQKDRQKDPNAGYARDLLPMLTQLWPAASSRGPASDPACSAPPA
ncbi:MAG: acyclic terpene utilization AtuA family protein, partial [Betaproteobacteria bacterium]|nr:acyclic terpene utilization AtuA family protein [Betaproteobacteria bacterium]